MRITLWSFSQCFYFSTNKIVYSSSALRYSSRNYKTSPWKRKIGRVRENGVSVSQWYKNNGIVIKQSYKNFNLSATRGRCDAANGSEWISKHSAHPSGHNKLFIFVKQLHVCEYSTSIQITHAETLSPHHLTVTSVWQILASAAVASFDCSTVLLPVMWKCIMSTMSTI